MKNINLILSEILKFGFVGIFTTTLSVLFYFIFLSLLKCNIYIVYLIGYPLFVILSYFLNTKYTFSKAPNITDGLTYILNYLASFFLGIILIFILSNTFIISDFIKMVVIIPPRTLLNYLLVKYFIFK